MGVGVIEYAAVIVSLLLTLGVGLYFNAKGSKSLQEYMLGSRRMGALPIGLSIAATVLTGSSMLSVSQEAYLFGPQPSLFAIIMAIYSMLSTWIYLPVSYSIKSASTFEYFERRFNSHIRLLASWIYVFDTIQHTAMTQYLPALTISDATGLPTVPTACVLSLICVAYTASGGLKAVAWADSFQTLVFASSAVLLFGVGTYKAGGLASVVNKVVSGSRSDFFDLNPSIFLRYSLLTILIGSATMMTSVVLTPSYHQRIAALPSLQLARKVALWSSLFQGIFLIITYSMGFLVYAYFAGCDPVLAKQGIGSHKTILPYFIQQTAVPGVMGVFVAGILAIGLSTTTSSWNTVACTIYEDILKPWLGPNVSTQTSFRILMGIVVATAVVSTAFIQVIQQIESLIEASWALKSVTLTVNFILYHGGMFFPWVQSKGIAVGSVCGGGVTLYLVHSIQRAKKAGMLKDLPKILTTAQCVVNGTTMEALNMTITIGTTGPGITTYRDPHLPWYSSISLMYYIIPGSVVGLVVACLVSGLTGGQDLRKVDRDMIVPQMRWVLPSVRNNEAEPDEEDVLFGENPKISNGGT